LLAHLGAYLELVAHDVEAAFASLRRLIRAILLLFCLATALVVTMSGVVIATAWFTSFRWPVTVAVSRCCSAAASSQSGWSGHRRCGSGSFDPACRAAVDAALLKHRFGTSVNAVVRSHG
jgi:hypothetical protein